MGLYMKYTWVYSILVKLSGDFEENPGPKHITRVKASQSVASM